MPIEPASSIVHALKYGGWGEVADEMAERMSRLSWPQDVVEERAAIVPIPLASARKRERGYNQSELIARVCRGGGGFRSGTARLFAPAKPAHKTRLTPEQRQGNVAGSFKIWRGKPDSLEGAHIVLVDDVVTTAATLNECAKVLYGAGARIISYVTFGRAHASGDRL